MCGGEEFIFFSPVFNFADACVSVGVVAMLLFCRKELATLGEGGKVTETEESAEDSTTTEEEGE
jgi:signal peptidase II